MFIKRRILLLMEVTLNYFIEITFCSHFELASYLHDQMRKVLIIHLIQLLARHDLHIIIINSYTSPCKSICNWKRLLLWVICHLMNNFIYISLLKLLFVCSFLSQTNFVIVPQRYKHYQITNKI